MPLQAVSAKEIHRRLELGEPDGVVARAVGRKERVIRYHRAWRCQCAVERPAVALVAPETVAPKSTPEAVPVDVGDPVAVVTMAYLVGISLLGIAAALGVDGYALDPDAVDFGLNGAAISRRRLERLAAKADALERMRLHRPAQWARLVTEAEESERKAALDSRLSRETWTGFFGEIAAHQSGLLIERDFRDWIEWVEDLTVARYPSMKD